MELTFLPIKEEIAPALKLEEELLEGTGNFCLVNSGLNDAIVLGITSDQKELVKDEAVKRFPILRRFSAGGCVFLDQNSIVTTFIFDAPRRYFPEEVLRWACSFYQEALAIPGFELRENDFAIEDKKCAGSALYIKEKRYLLHTSFLFDYDPEKMELLLLPKKAPAYRKNRGHRDFLAKLKDHIKSKEEFERAIAAGLGRRYEIKNSPRRETASYLSTR